MRLPRLGLDESLRWAVVEKCLGRETFLSFAGHALKGEYVPSASAEGQMPKVQGDANEEVL